MKWIFSDLYIMNNKEIFFGVIIIFVAIIVFSVIMAYKEIKNVNK